LKIYCERQVIITVKLVTDSTSYIGKETQDDLDINVVNLSVNFPDEVFDETIVSYEYFYNKIERDNVIPTSSQPPLGDICRVFRDLVAKGNDVLGIFISSQMSGTHDSAKSAKEIVLKEFPDSRIEIIDSKTNCMALGLQVVEAAKAAQLGKTIDDVMEIALDIRKKVRFYFVPATLDYLIKGGRIGGASALIGSLLSIRPILYVNDGVTDVLTKVRGSGKAKDKLIEKLQEDVKRLGLKHLLVHNIHDPLQGEEFAARLGRQFKREVESMSIGPVIGAHVGPGAIGIVYSTDN